MSKINVSKWFTDKASMLRAALQAGRAHSLAVAKANRQPKKKAMTLRKAAYVPGNGMVSSVSVAISEEYGAILSRRERRALAKEAQVPFKPYYNGK
jgi:predicted sugar kinase